MRLLYLAAALAFSGCKDDRSRLDPPEPVLIQAKDQAGTVVAELMPIRPCRASIAGKEMIIGGPPLISTYGSTKWAGESQPNGTVLTRDGERIARVYPVGDPKGTAVIDMKGVAVARVAVTGDVATVSDSATVPVRTLQRVANTIVSNELDLTVSGTDDLVLAAVLTAPEIVPEIRMLASCERVLLPPKSGDVKGS